MVAEITKHPQPLRISATDAAEDNVDGIENCWLDITASAAKISSKNTGGYFSRRTGLFRVSFQVNEDDVAVAAALVSTSCSFELVLRFFKLSHVPSSLI